MSPAELPQASIAFIIVAPTEDKAATAVAFVRLSDYPDSAYEIILGLGNNPSEQRNRAAALATAEFLYFLDNDTEVGPQTPGLLASTLSANAAAAVIGGPSRYVAQGGSVAKAIQQLFESSLALGPCRSRYTPIGTIRKTSENELILCNMMVRREFFLSQRGFNRDLYPNEENEFLNRVSRATVSLYHPAGVASRQSRSGVLPFVRQIMRYGMGRAKQLLVSKRPFNLIYLVPFAFVAYCVALWSPSSPLGTTSFAKAPLAVYAVAIGAAAMSHAWKQRNAALVILMPPLYFICHAAYGVGLGLGFLLFPFLTRRPPEEITVKVLKALPRVEIQPPHRAAG